MDITKIPKGWRAIKASVDAANQAAEATRLASIPTPIKASEAYGQHEGKYLKSIPYDRMKIDLTTGARGGVGFSGLQHGVPAYAEARAASGVTDKKMSTRILNRNQNLPEGSQVIWTPSVGALTQHKSNTTMFNQFADKFNKERKNLSDEQLQVLSDRASNAVDNKGRLIFPEGIDLGAKNYRGLIKNYDQRGVVADVFAGKGVGGEKGRTVAVEKMLDENLDPYVADVPTGSLGNRLFTLDNGVIVRPDLHPDYPYILTGEDLGVNYIPVPRENVMETFANIPRFSKKTGEPRAVTDIDYRTGDPTQLLDNELLSRMQSEGYKGGGTAKKHGHSFEEDLAAAFAEVIAEHNPKPMHGEITVKTSAPVKMAMGGAVTSDYNTVPDDNDGGAIIQNPSNFAKGGRASIIDALDKVSDEESIDHQIERYLNRVRLSGSGGKDAYGTNVGGSLGLDIPLSKDVTISPYLEGYTYKPTNQPIGGQVTGAGANLTMRFKDGGVARKRNVDELHPLAEVGFQRDIKNSPWYAEFVKRYQEQPDIREGGDYNLRKAWAYGAEPQRDPYDNNSLHWPSALPNGDMLKAEYHPTAWKEHFMREYDGLNPDSIGATKEEFEARQEKPIHMGYGGLAKRALRGLKGTNVAEGNKTSIIKDTGGNWLSGSVEEHLSPLRQTARGATPSERLARYNQLLEAATDDASRALIQRDINTATREDALDKWIGGNLTKYVKNQMGTAEDPVRKLAEQEIVHYSPSGYVDRGEHARTLAGTPQLGKSDKAKAWENITDYIVEPSTVAKEISQMDFFANAQKLFKKPLTSTIEPWMTKVDPSTKVYGINDTFNPQNLGYDHIMDVLREDLTTGRILPENLNKMSMEHAVRRTHEYDTELAKRMKESSAAAREGLPVRKEYPNTGFRWVELNKPGSFAAESDAMGHSARGYEPPKGHADWVPASGDSGNPDYGLGGWEAIKSGKVKMYSLVDKEGKSHATIEVHPGDDTEAFYQANKKVLDNPIFRRELDLMADPNVDASLGHQYVKNAKKLLTENNIKYNEAEHNFPDINQIKPPGNYWESDPSRGRIANSPTYKEDIQPYMQDFVKSGQWSEVRDLENTGLKTLDNAFSDYESKKNFSRANPNTRYVNQKEIDDWNKQWGSSGDTPVEGMANGGQAHYNKAKQVVESTQDLIDKFVEMYEKASGKEPKPPKEVFRDPWDMKDGGAPLRRDVSELIPFSPHLPSAVSAGLDWVKGKVLDEAKTYSNPRAIPDVATNVAADWVGMPVDIAKILADVADYGGEKVANAITGRSSKKLSDLVKEDEHEKPTFGSSEYIKDYLKEKGVTTGTERPISEFAAFPVAPALLRGATRTGKKYLNQPPHLTQKEYDDILSGQPPRKLRNVNELHPLY